MKIISILVSITAILVIGCSSDKEGSQEASQQKTKSLQTMPSKPNDVSVNCPKCGAPGVPIIYGKPGRKLLEKAKNKEIYLGGCCIYTDSPQKHHCYKCQIDFGSEK